MLQFLGSLLGAPEARPVPRPTAFRPSLDSLDARELPSVTPVPFSSPTSSTWVLRDLTGDADNVVISDNGTGGVNNITVTANGVTYLPGRSLWEIRLDTGGGNDTVEYRLSQPLTSGGYYHELEIDLGAGNDRYTAYMPGLSAGAPGINSYVNGQAGNDTIVANVWGNIPNGTALGFGLTGGQGADTVRVNATYSALNVATGGLLWANIHGNEGWSDTINNADSANTIDLLYNGDLDGRLSFNLHGTAANDTMRFDATLAAGSTGVIGDRAQSGSATMLGGSGDDTMTFRVRAAGVAPVWNAVLDGGAGVDTAHYSDDIARVWAGLSVRDFNTHNRYVGD